jgi:hypothetical protein
MAGGRIRRIHFYLAVQSAVVVLLSINRLSSLTLGYVSRNEFLRWVDFNNLLTLPLVSLVAFYFLKRELEVGIDHRLDGRHTALGLVFLTGAYLFGAGYGVHEITNYLHARFCLSGASSDLCRIVIFNDDQFSHWVWFVGFLMINLSLLLLQALIPSPSKLSRGDLVLLILNGLFIGAGIFANLAFERIGLDLYVVAVVTFLAWFLLARQGPKPLLVYYSTAYGLGLVGTALYKLLVG